jgi:ribonuclease VapC
MTTYVLDSFAILALLNRESGADRVRAVLDGLATGDCSAMMCAANLGEVFYIVKRRRGEDEALRVVALLRSLDLRIIALDERLALMAGSIKAEHPMSFADCMAAAVAQDCNATLLTADPEFKAVDGLVAVEWLR